MTERHELITAEELAHLAEIDRLLDEANNHSLAQDGHCKSSEGHIGVSLGNHWDRDPDEPRKPVGVDIYSYLLGPHRSHHFDNTQQALDVVQVWHHNEMHEDQAVPDLYTKLEEQRAYDFQQFMQDMDALYGEGEVRP